MSLYIYLTSLNTYGSYIENMSHIAIMLNGYICTSFLLISTKIQPNATPTSHNIAKYLPETNMPSNTIYMPNMQICSCEIGDNYISRYTSWTHCNQQCHQDHWNIYFTHYWHMPLTNMPAILHVYVLLHCYCNLHIEQTLLYTVKK